jgi:hypothetical protein
MAIGSRPTFMGFPAEFVATRIGMTWPRQESGFLASMLNSMRSSILTSMLNGIPGPMPPNMLESSTYTVVPSGLTASRVGIFRQRSAARPGRGGAGSG